MPKKKPHASGKETKTLSILQQPFYKRFNISIDLEEVKRRFVNRIRNQVFDSFFVHDVDEEIVRADVLWGIANALGEEYDWDGTFDDFVLNDFEKCLQVLESAYRALDSQNLKKQLSDLVSDAVKSSEIDLGVDWRQGVFVPRGAVLLDEALVNENLAWLSDPQYSNVYGPFDKGLTHYYRMLKEPKFAFDVVTDMYEALEALAKIITNRPNNDLSSNAELFISKVKASDGYKSILRTYIQFANDFRHGIDSKATRSPLKPPEVESFIYLTGIFIRLAKSSDK